MKLLRQSIVDAALDPCVANVPIVRREITTVNGEFIPTHPPSPRYRITRRRDEGHAKRARIDFNVYHDPEYAKIVMETADEQAMRDMVGSSRWCKTWHLYVVATMWRRCIVYITGFPTEKCHIQIVVPHDDVLIVDGSDVHVPYSFTELYTVEEMKRFVASHGEFEPIFIHNDSYWLIGGDGKYVPDKKRGPSHFEAFTTQTSFRNLPNDILSYASDRKNPPFTLPAYGSSVWKPDIMGRLPRNQYLIDEHYPFGRVTVCRGLSSSTPQGEQGGYNVKDVYIMAANLCYDADPKTMKEEGADDVTSERRGGTWTYFYTNGSVSADIMKKVPAQALEDMWEVEATMRMEATYMARKNGLLVNETYVLSLADLFIRPYRMQDTPVTREHVDVSHISVVWVLKGGVRDSHGIDIYIVPGDGDENPGEKMNMNLNATDMMCLLGVPDDGSYEDGNENIHSDVYPGVRHGMVHADRNKPSATYKERLTCVANYYIVRSDGDDGDSDDD